MLCYDRERFVTNRTLRPVVKSFFHSGFPHLWTTLVKSLAEYRVVPGAVWIEGHPPGGNERKRMHHMGLYKVDKEWAAFAGWAFKAARASLPPGTPYGMCNLAIEWHFREKRRRDWDNLMASLKGILDGLTGNLYADDSSDCIIEVRQTIKISPRSGLLIRPEPLMVTIDSAAFGAQTVPMD
jgi:Holliday junction resolvase RusA-like endonuclease